LLNNNEAEGIASWRAKSVKPIITFIIILAAAQAYASEMNWSFKSPAFHYGNGYSTHVLTTEQLLHNRQEDKRKTAEAEQRELERQLENTTLSKFVKNVESRIYATLSKQMVDSMFADCSTECATSGTAEIEGSTISWEKDTTTGMISLQVVEADGTITKIEIPGSGEFNF
tara:strand:+ start:2165 stop:2677 length:513 start_codon:yes stop_codon:yes gene_type:complete